MDQDLEDAIKTFPEVKPWVEKLLSAGVIHELLELVISAMKDDELGKIGGLFYSGYASVSIGAVAEKRMNDLKSAGG